MILKNTELVKTGHQHTQFQIEQIHVAMTWPDIRSLLPSPQSPSQTASSFMRCCANLIAVGFTHSAVATRAAPFPITTVQPINKSSRHTNRRRRTASGPPSRHVHTGSRAHSFTIRTTAAGLDASRAQIPLTLRRLAALTRTHHHHTSRSCIVLRVVLPHDWHLKHTAHDILLAYRQRCAARFPHGNEHRNPSGNVKLRHSRRRTKKRSNRGAADI